MEKGVQSTAAKAGQEKEASSEGNRRLTLVDRLRDRAFAFKAPDPLIEEAADEIERLRQFGRLTSGERLALEFAIGVYPLDDSIPATLRSLLERLK